MTCRVDLVKPKLNLFPKFEKIKNKYTKLHTQITGCPCRICEFVMQPSRWAMYLWIMQAATPRRLMKQTPER